jgi:hypothetical protein
MLDAGRLHLYAASIRFTRGRWQVTLTGLAAEFHRPDAHPPADIPRCWARPWREIPCGRRRMGDLGRMLAYKARWYGCDLVVADRWYPSSKTCSGCGHVKDRLDLAERIYRCGRCGSVLDRDVNAAVNLARWPDHHTSPPLLAVA